MSISKESYWKIHVKTIFLSRRREKAVAKAVILITN